MRFAVLLAELRRRKVFRVAAVYGATAFVILQAADIIFPRLRLPDWSVTLVVALALMAFPIVMLVTWAFDASPGGLRRTEPAAGGELDALLAESAARRWLAVLAAAVGVALLAAGGVWTLGLGADRASSYDSVAVLPFSDMSGDAANEYFGEGLAEELLNALSGVPGLKVAARTSAFAFRNSSLDVRRIGDTLGVATLVEGSVRRSADRVRIAARLVDARTGYRLWDETYDRPLTELFTVQEAIAREIAGALAGRFRSAPERDLYLGGTTDVTAYEMYLAGRQQWATRRVTLLQAAVRQFEGAIARDSTFALAWSGLANAIEALAWRVPAERPRIPAARHAAQTALALEPRLAEAWTSLGGITMDFDHDLRLAELQLRQAIALKPSYAVSYNWLADALRYSGRLEEAAEQSARAVELDRLNGGGLTVLIEIRVAQGRYADARQLADRARAFGYSDHAFFLNLMSAARVLGYTADESAGFGREWARASGFAQADSAALVGRAVVDANLRPHARALLRAMAGAGVNTRDLTQLCLSIEDNDCAMQYLQQSFEAGDPTLVRIGTIRAYDPLRADPGFIRIVQALGLPNGR